MKTHKLTAVKIGLFTGALLASLTTASAQPATKNVFLSAPTGGLTTPIGIAYSPQQNALLVTEPFCGGSSAGQATGFSVAAISSTGVVSNFANLPNVPLSSNPNFGHSTAPFNQCFEDYLAVSPGLGGFTPGNVFVTQGQNVVQIPAAGGAATFFAGPMATKDTESAISFDSVGTFCNQMIITGANGTVFLVSSTGVVTPYAQISSIVSTSTTVALESSTVAPMAFAPYGGWLIVAAEDSSTGPLAAAIQPPTSCNPIVIPNGGTPLVHNISSQPGGPEGLVTVPASATSCNFGTQTAGGTLFSVTYTSGVVIPNLNNAYQIVAYPTSNFTGLVGDIMVSNEGDVGGPPNTNVLSSNGGATVTSTLFDGGTVAPKFVQQEGLTFASCPAVPATGCPATQGFWHKAANWPAVNAFVDGIQYNGKSGFTMTIGGITYTQAELLQVMPSGGLHSGNYANGLSELVAAVLNVAAGAQKTVAADAAIASDNSKLAGVQIFCAPGNTTLCSVSSTVSDTVQGNLTALDNYNSAVGLGCTEGAGLTTGSGKN